MVITPRDARIAVVTALVVAGIAYLAFVPAPVPPKEEAVPPVAQAPVAEAPKPAAPAPTPVVTTPKPAAPKPAPKPTAEVLVLHEGFNETVRELVLTATAQDAAVALRWTASTSASFQGYRIVRSLDNPAPYFPKDPSIRFVTERTNVSYVDAGATKGKTYYYRACALIKNGLPTCGNVVKLSF